MTHTDRTHPASHSDICRFWALQAASGGTTANLYQSIGGNCGRDECRPATSTAAERVAARRAARQG